MSYLRSLKLDAGAAAILMTVMGGSKGSWYE
jgi:hypothetical protein